MIEIWHHLLLWQMPWCYRPHIVWCLLGNVWPCHPTGVL